MTGHPQAAFADAVNALAARFAAASDHTWDRQTCTSEAETYWREAIRRGWRLDGERPLVTSAIPAAAEVLAESRQRLARGQIPGDDARRAALAAAKAAIAPPLEALDSEQRDDKTTPETAIANAETGTETGDQPPTEETP